MPAHRSPSGGSPLEDRTSPLRWTPWNRRSGATAMHASNDAQGHRPDVADPPLLDPEIPVNGRRAKNGDQWLGEDGGQSRGDGGVHHGGRYFGWSPSRVVGTRASMWKLGYGDGAPCPGAHRGRGCVRVRDTSVSDAVCRGDPRSGVEPAVWRTARSLTRDGRVIQAFIYATNRSNQMEGCGS